MYDDLWKKQVKLTLLDIPEFLVLAFVAAFSILSVAMLPEGVYLGERMTGQEAANIVGGYINICIYILLARTIVGLAISILRNESEKVSEHCLSLIKGMFKFQTIGMLIILLDAGELMSVFSVCVIMLITKKLVNRGRAAVREEMRMLIKKELIINWNTSSLFISDRILKESKLQVTQSSFEKTLQPTGDNTFTTSASGRLHFGLAFEGIDYRFTFDSNEKRPEPSRFMKAIGFVIHKVRK